MRKFVPLLVIILALISCQEDDDFDNKVVTFEKTMSDPGKEIKKDNTSIIEGNVNMSSTKEGDPPVKNGDHWKH